MADLIDRQAILNHIEKIRRGVMMDGSRISSIIVNGMDLCEKAVMNQPTVDAVPVVHGHWKEDTGGYGFWICSHCGFVSEASAADLLYRYCPHCGARMEESEEEKDAAD